MKNMQVGSQLSPGDPTCIGLAMLLRAHHYALDTGSSSWDFAVEIADLRSAGLSNSEFRWLLARGFAEHAEETTGPHSPTRQFSSLGKHQFPDGTCFVLLPKGLAFIDRGSETPSISGMSSVTESCEQSASRRTCEVLKPVWDSREKELLLNDVVVKRFRWPAPNQELLLDVFEEEAWPRRIDDPLSKAPEQDPRRRLHDTIKCLNRNQENRLIRFRGDGSGEGVAWEFFMRNGSARPLDRGSHGDRQ